MDAKELRIGNYVKTHWENLYEWSALDFWEGIKFEPIPLTEEWLLKFGFNSDDDNCYFLDTIKGTYYWKEKNEDGVWYMDSNNEGLKEILYVHTLQNLYFALTGEELTLKNE